MRGEKPSVEAPTHQTTYYDSFHMYCLTTYISFSQHASQKLPAALDEYGFAFRHIFLLIHFSTFVFAGTVGILAISVFHRLDRVDWQNHRPRAGFLLLRPRHPIG